MIYERHFGLTGEPFSLSPDPSFLYLSPGHAEARAALEIGLLGRRGLLVLTGEVGTGKTTLLYSLLPALRGGIRTSYIANTKLPFDELLRLALTDFGVSVAGASRADLLSALNAFLHACAHEGATAALVVDEAQNLDDDNFENLRLLSNFETFTGKLLQIVLVGQPELEVKLQHRSLRQVAERVAVRCHLNPLTAQQCRKYLAYRLEQVDGSLDLFTPAARRLLIGASQGIPRRLNIIAHNALLFGYGHGATRVSRRAVREAVKERSGRGLVLIHPHPAINPFALRPRWWRPSLAAAIAMLAATGAVAGLWWRDTVRPRVQGPADLLTVESAAAANTLPLNGEVAEAARPDPSKEAEPAQTANLKEPIPEPIAAAPAVVDGASRAPEPVPPSQPSGLRSVRVPAGTTLVALVKQVYGRANAELIARVRAVNSQITDPDRIVAGDTLLFPAAASASALHP